jgi:hypothetical protein
MGPKIQRASREYPLVTIFSPNPCVVAECGTPKRNMPLAQPSRAEFPLLLSCFAFPEDPLPTAQNIVDSLTPFRTAIFQFLA